MHAVIGIDANVLLRVILADDPRQASVARAFLSDHCSSVQPGFVSNVVLAEVTWVLARGYGCSRKQIADAIEQILETAQLRVESSADVIAALSAFRKGSAEFSDCLIAQVNRAAGCECTMTFDRKAAKQPGFKLLAV